MVSGNFYFNSLFLSWSSYLSAKETGTGGYTKLQKYLKARLG